MNLDTQSVPSLVSENPNRPHRLLLLCTAMGMGGGAEEQVMRLAYSFHARGWPTLMVSMLPPDRMPADFADKKIPLRHLGMKAAIPDPRGLFRLAAIIREFRPDIIHSHMVHANLLARLARILVPYSVQVSTLHNLTMAGVVRDHTGVFEVAHRWTDRLSERTTAICHAASDYYITRRAVPAAKMMTVHNGIDPARFAPNPAARQRVRKEMGLDGQFVWLCIGRLVLQKAYPTLLRAMAQLREGNRTLLICGIGPLHDELVSLAKQLGVADRVRFLGLRGDVPDLMSAADSFCLSSDMEGLPLVLLQAAAAGLPIVATNVAGNPEVVTEGVNGYLTPTGDSEAFARAMSRVEGLDAGQRSAFAEAGITHVRANFEAERIADKWEKLFRELMETGGGQLRRTAASLPRTDRDQALAPCAS